MLLAMRAVANRVGVKFRLPFRDFSTFRTYWLAQGASGPGAWQARRALLDVLFNDLHDKLADLETQILASSLADPVSPLRRTGWPSVDNEIAELRRHFQAAHTALDYRNVGNDCVLVIEELSGTVYSAERHLRSGEEEPPIANTKQRLDRFIEDSLPGADNAALRKLARATIEMVQAVKHRSTPTRREAGIAADAVILLANLLRRIDEPQERV